jgi:hypothetical protein
MVPGWKEDASDAGNADKQLLFVFFLIVIFFVLGEVAIFSNFLLLVLFVFLVLIGNDVQMDGMDLRDFQLGLAFWATENLAFFDFIFVDVDLGGTFWAADHGSILRNWFNVGAARTTSTTVERIIYRREVNPARMGCGWK